MIYCLNHKKKWVKFLAILPFAVAVLSFVAKAIETSESCMGCAYKLTVWWFPAFLRLQYDWMSLAFMGGYFASYYVAKLIYKIREEEVGLSAEAMEGTNEWRMMVNLSAVFFTIFVSIAYYLISYINADIVFWAPKIQIASIAAIVFIAFYSGKRGYNAPWFNWFSYFYYLVHIGLIFGICYLIYLV